MLPTGSCQCCLEAIGDDIHELHQCEALQGELLRQRLLGRIGRRLPDHVRSAGCVPLLAMGLPPRCTKWGLVAREHPEGEIGMGFDGEAYGDGSGFGQQHRDARVATWSLVRGVNAMGRTSDAENVRGIADGWMPTVPRGELQASIQFLSPRGRRQHS